MKPKLSEVEQLLATCPTSFDPWTLEPLKSISFLDPLLSHEELPLSNAQPPISFPDLDLPLIRFNTEVTRDFDTGEALNVTSSCPTGLFSDAEEIASASSAAQPVLAEICDRFKTDIGLEKGGLLKECFGTVPAVSNADALVDTNLALCSETALDRFIRSGSPIKSPEPDSSQDDSLGDERKQAMNPETQALLEKRMRQPTDDITHHSVLVSQAAVVGNSHRPTCFVFSSTGKQCREAPTPRRIDS